MRIRRERHPRPLRKVVFIQCEGEKSEYNYLNSFRKHDIDQNRIKFIIKSGEGGDALQTVRKALNEKKKQKSRNEEYDECWCILDVEDVSRRDILQGAILLAQKNNVELFLSNPCFEVWIIAHFERTPRHFLNSKTVIEYLNNIQDWQRLFNKSYDKSDVELFAILHERLDTAVSNSKWIMEKHHQAKSRLDCNSSTEIFRLILKLRGSDM